MNTSQWILFALNLLREYGPTLVKLGREVYKFVEEKARSWKAKSPESGKDIQAGLVSKVKASEFDKQMAAKWQEAKNSVPASRDLRRFGQKIWVLMNRGKVAAMDKSEVQKVLSVG